MDSRANTSEAHSSDSILDERSELPLQPDLDRDAEGLKSRGGPQTQDSLGGPVLLRSLVMRPRFAKDRAVSATGLPATLGPRFPSCLTALSPFCSEPATYSCNTRPRQTGRSDWVSIVVRGSFHAVAIWFAPCKEMSHRLKPRCCSSNLYMLRCESPTWVGDSCLHRNLQKNLAGLNPICQLKLVSNVPHTSSMQLHSSI